MSLGESLNHALNRMAGTTGLDASGAAAAWAGIPGASLCEALNALCGLTLPRDYLDIAGALNQLAGTDGLDWAGAASHLGEGGGLLLPWDAGTATKDLIDLDLGNARFPNTTNYDGGTA